MRQSMPCPTRRRSMDFLASIVLVTEEDGLYFGPVLERLTTQLTSDGHLTEDDVHSAVEQLVDEAVPALAKANFLCGLALKGAQDR